MHTPVQRQGAPGSPAQSLAALPDSPQGGQEVTAGVWETDSLDRRRFLQLAGITAAGVPLLSWRPPPVVAEPLARVKLGSPILTESVLLDLLPIRGKDAQVLRGVQAEIERATILRTLYRKANDIALGTAQTVGKEDSLKVQVKTRAELEALEANSTVTQDPLGVPPSVWDKIVTVGENAMSMLESGRGSLTPAFREVDNAEVQIRRAERGETKYYETKNAVQRMIGFAKAHDPKGVLASQEEALFNLAYLGELMVPEFPFKVTTDEQYDTIPRLLGRATVVLQVRRDKNATATAEGRIVPAPADPTLGNITMVVDGFSSPVTAGNFIDLCLRGFYNDLPLRFQDSDEETETPIKMMTGGIYRQGFVDPQTGNLRRLPLEILRSEAKKGDRPLYGAARNTKIFTKAPVVQTFQIAGAVGMKHPARDGNGASSQFFWVRDDNLEPDGYFMSPEVGAALDERYSIFAYIVGGRKLLSQLQDGDVVEKATVLYGADNLIKTKAASFAELLLKNGGEDD